MGNLLQDGSLPLTANWNAGNFSIYSYNGLRWYNAKDGFNAKIDGKRFTDGVSTSGSTTFTSATANFVAGDVGKVICIAQTLAITGATNASPIVITAAGHGIAVNAVVWVRNVGGNDLPPSSGPVNMTLPRPSGC